MILSRQATSLQFEQYLVLNGAEEGQYESASMCALSFSPHTDSVL
eukprot:CAMPEP_0113900622 /NCGR_PEP_ID=MMETSP0780_2-20120614/20783_1 /TAXON_ID=652834 /ORGANISM="Palpitomonas bilix" /LENGTH=44 /DNA_ID=CAMNT_0000893109 /DNA_START=213 /DNA_END=344 /DNA_ORIENTATION=+ /assembly_acc=CAM_ASM_000599